jgi:hypothetical protein
MIEDSQGWKYKSKLEYILCSEEVGIKVSEGISIFFGLAFGALAVYKANYEQINEYVAKTVDYVQNLF